MTYSFDKNEFYYQNSLISLTKKQKFLLYLFFSQPESLLTESYLSGKIW
jgi:DNA-binding response OmpR family regulator